jgi:hypothetical protein
MEFIPSLRSAKLLGPPDAVLGLLKLSVSFISRVATSGFFLAWIALLLFAC